MEVMISAETSQYLATINHKIKLLRPDSRYMTQTKLTNIQVEQY